MARYKIYLCLWKYSAWQSIFYLLTNAMSMPWSSAQWIAWRPLPRSICCPASPRCCWCWPVSPRCWCWPPPASPYAPPPCTRFGLTYFWYRQIFFLYFYIRVVGIKFFLLKSCWYAVPFNELFTIIAYVVPLLLSCWLCSSFYQRVVAMPFLIL